MKEENDVRISEFLDGELAKSELDALIRECRSTDGRETLSRYQLIGQLMRGETATVNSADISQSVMSAIASMPASDQVVAQQPATAATSDHVLTGWLSGWMKPALGVAFAASVAMVTVLVNQQNTGPSQAPALADATTQQPLAIDVNVPAQQLAETNEVREQLNNYLVNHARSASGSNYQGMVPYVRAVAYEPEQVKQDQGRK